MFSITMYNLYVTSQNSLLAWWYGMHCFDDNGSDGWIRNHLYIWMDFSWGCGLGSGTLNWVAQGTMLHALMVIVPKYF